MAEPQYNKYMAYYSKERIMYSEGYQNLPFSYQYKNSHVSHNHIIPADENIKNALMSLHLYQKIYMEGYLVFVNGPYGNYSSLSRTDVGYSGSAGPFSGSCEVFYVKN